MHAVANPVIYTRRDPRFFEDRDRQARTAAETIGPLVLERYKPESVIDRGCGVGTWQSVFQEHGIDDLLEVESEAANAEFLQVDPSCFRQHDLTRPLPVDRAFDLALASRWQSACPRNRRKGSSRNRAAAAGGA